MSVKVDLDQLADILADFPFGYLVTVGDDYHAHTVAVEPILTEGVLDVGAIGSRTRSNVSRHEDVTLLWPPRQPDGYTLIVDGSAQAPATDDEHLQVVPNRAVLHRKAAPDSAAAADGCRHDCVPLDNIVNHRD